MSKAMLALAESVQLFSEEGEYVGSGMDLGSSSTMSGEIDALYYFIAALGIFFFVVIIAVMVYFVWKYREKNNETHPTHPLEGNFRLEVAWSVIPALLLVVIFAWGFRDYMKLAVPPGDAFEVRVTAQKWFWQFEYPGGVASNNLVVPANRPVKLVMKSEDVLHSMFIPAFRVKKDVIPNRYSVLWFEATEPGIFQFQCTEYCGTNHSMMGTLKNEKTGKFENFVKVLPQAEFDAWLASGGPLGEPEQEGSDGQIVEVAPDGKITFKSATADFSSIPVRDDASKAVETPRPLKIEGSKSGNDGSYSVIQVLDPNTVVMTRLAVEEGKAPPAAQSESAIPWKLDKDPVKKGEILFNKILGCSSCHSMEGEKKVGPPLNGLYQRGGEDTTGGRVSWKPEDTEPGDDPFRNYITESILYPNAKIVSGYNGKMPSFKGRKALEGGGIDNIIEYIRSVE